jgi:23S rRNA (cytidine1920-2'-O)/16S rRNA (cytidine1409-2'-O)-methyltransferase
MSKPRPTASKIDNRQSTIDNPFVSRGGDKLDAALKHFQLDVSGRVCADLGSHTGGFVDCLLRRGAAKVYAVDTAYGILAWKLRKDPRVVVRERSNAMHVSLPEPVEIITIDVGWTRQAKILPAAARLLACNGSVVTLIKPHYEARVEELRNGVLPDDRMDGVVANVLAEITAQGWTGHGACPSPIRGHGGNREVFAWLSPSTADR